MDEALPAATVVLLRDGAASVEVLMVRRTSKVAFGGMWAFPGGRVEPADVDPAAPDDELRTARRAAARETAEEIGVIVDTEALVPFSHWTPPPIAPRRFSTWFFVVAAPDQHGVAVDGQEIDDHCWLPAAQVLARRDAGEVELAAPTWVTLWRLSAAGSTADAIADAHAREPERFATRLVIDGDSRVALWHGDA